VDTRLEPQAHDAKTSFGEVLFANPSVSISEGRHLKIVPLGPDCMVGIAGDLKRAETAIEMLSGVYRPSMSVADAFDYLGTSLDRAVEMHFYCLVAKSGTNGPELWRWSSETFRAERVSGIQQIGSLQTWHVDATEQMYRALADARIDEDQMSIALTAVVQSYGLRDGLLNEGVGGFFVGVRVSRMGVKWTQDTNYFLYHPSLTHSNFISNAISIYCRGGGVVVASPSVGDISVFLSKFSVPTEEWEHRFTYSIAYRAQHLLARYWVFVDLSKFAVFIVDAHTNALEIPCLKKAKVKGTFSSPSVLVEALSAPIPSAAGEMPRSFAFSTAEGSMRDLANILALRTGMPSYYTLQSEVG
jgi:hypothetical protein